MERLNFVSCVAWVRKGVARPFKLDLSESSIRSRIKMNREKLKELTTECPIATIDSSGDPGVMTPATSTSRTIDEDDLEIIERYNLATYDDDEDEDDIYQCVVDDPYMNLDQYYSDDDEEMYDFKIKKSDNLVLAGHIENDSVSLEVKVYNPSDQCYVHHDIYLEAFPLCFKPLSHKPYKNLVAVGDMKKDINIWDLDFVDTLDPVMILKGHKKSVLDIAWNKTLEDLLVSGSVDHKCLIWDLNIKKCIQEFNIFQSNVQTLDFHPLERNILLAGDSSGKSKLINCQINTFKNINVCNEEVEKVRWNLKHPNRFMCADSSGFIYCFDCRLESKQVFSFQAHDDMISGFEFLSQYEDGYLLVTSSSDKLVKVWLHENDEEHPKLLKKISPNVGTILSLAVSPDYPSVIAVGGDDASNENCKVIDLKKYDEVAHYFCPDIFIHPSSVPEMTDL